MIIIRLLLVGICILYNVSILVNAATCPAGKEDNCPNEGGDTACTAIFPLNQTAPNANCENAAYEKVLPLCYKACKACCKNPNYSCEDATGLNPLNCTQIGISGSCSNPLMESMVAQYCPGTCGKCGTSTGSSCSDKNATLCQALTTVCLMQQWETFVVENCPKTCNKCDQVPAQTTTVLPGSFGCQDIATDCVEKSSLCTVDAYSSLMRQQCARTCNMC